MGQIYNPALQADIDELRNLGEGVQGVDFKSLGNKLQQLLPENGPVVTQQAVYAGYPYGYPYAYAAAPVVNTKYGKLYYISYTLLALL